ncbi:type II toxin-antitoxin system PemK/MazF family toxin [Leptolyngbya sp. CCNP1308]|uniref:type II toxin-antitoxin system PemK/MazF family toxin n=1 Tax=Leptolyngbya sp. CCNP1308 TaxID=3110255 RepID=UPI002B1F41C6|nr:type II toxin-antitoxin system PemK/MazF family toxin [Leptolyngbya sp. CCNP1308]MEA5450793.1 type II toxin-antitoxin system PemK/MazF family toxin [Leptolyngbya sp. CCNP1308]
MIYSRGEIVLVLFPNFNTRTAKRRPVLVVQATELNTGLPQLIMAMISSNMKRAGHPSRIAIQLNSPESSQSGLLTHSVIMADNLATILESEIDRKLVIWSDMLAVDLALCHTLGIGR